MIGVDHLREEKAEGHDRGVDAMIGPNLLGLERLIDHVGVEQFVEGEQVGLVEGFHFRREGRRDSLGHRRPPCGRAWLLFPPILVPREADVCLSPSALIGYAKSQCHSCPAPFLCPSCYAVAVRSMSNRPTSVSPSN